MYSTQKPSIEIISEGDDIMVHYIYCYTNKINGHKYIGQTNDLARRKKQHIQDSIHCHKGHEVSYELPFHRAIRRYGIDNFDFEILEKIDTEDWEKVNELESKYINKMKTIVPNGYNLQARGQANKGKNKSYIPDEVSNEIIEKLKNKIPIKEIAEEYNLSRSYISDINNGRCLRREDEKYPLQQNRITKQEYIEIIDLIVNSNYSFSSIAKYMDRNIDTIKRINKGEQKIIRELWDGEFPLRKETKSGYTLKPVETIPE